jgi:hypothetical protein
LQIEAIRFNHDHRQTTPSNLLNNTQKIITSMGQKAILLRSYHVETAGVKHHTVKNRRKIMIHKIGVHRKRLVAIALTIIFGLSFVAPVASAHAAGKGYRTNCCIARPPGPD